MLANKRGWLLGAVVTGLVFQFFYFFQSQTVTLSAAVEAPPSIPEQQLAANQAQPSQPVDVQAALASAQARPPWENQLPPAQQGPPPFIPSPYNYSASAVPTEFTLPPPNRTNQSTIVICLSARDNFDRRAAIRESWAKGNDNIYFIVGGPVPGNHEDMDTEDPLSTSSLLFREQHLFGDIIDTIHPDTYRSLPYKLHFAMRWIMKNNDNVNWIAKADDDMIVRVKLLEFFVLRKMNPYHPQVIGQVAVEGRPHRAGKWAEDPKFKDPVYPPWAFGSAGYVVSRPVAQYIADHNDLYYYQGEDAGLGIWLSQSPLQVTWVDTPELLKDEECPEKAYIIGHDLSIDAIRNCFARLGDTVPDRSHIIAFSAGRKGMFPNRIQ